MRTSLSAFFAWCVSEGLLESNPVTGSTRPADPPVRDRVLKHAELRAILKLQGQMFETVDTVEALAELSHGLDGAKV